MATFKSKTIEYKLDPTRVLDFVRELQGNLEREVENTISNLPEAHKNLQTGIYIWDTKPPRLLKELIGDDNYQNPINFFGKIISIAVDAFVDPITESCLAFPVRMGEIRMTKKGRKLTLKTTEFEGIVINPEVIYKIAEKYSKK
ncbi:MAG: hypothetical protein KKH88_04055 [Nanoarchaeota archaeon]|nr:hypothetical protein [Nanoarchaeota archaeon]